MTYPNQLHQTNWRLEIPDNGATGDFVIAVQRATIPNIEIEPVPIMVNRVARGTVPGSGVTFTPLMFTFLVDEDMKSYADLYQWMLSICDWRELKSTGIGAAAMSHKTILLHILDNSKQKIVATFRFVDAWPTSIGEVEVSYNDEGNMVIICQAMFNYKYMELLIDGVPIKPMANVVPQNTGPAIGMHPSMR